VEVSASRLGQIGWLKKLLAALGLALQLAALPLKNILSQSKKQKNHMNEHQETLINVDPLWKEHWNEMPEFVMGDESPQRTIRVHFRNNEDVQQFAKLLGQKISDKTKSVWHPAAQNRITSDKHYVDES
jgi:hypothetical protein